MAAFLIERGDQPEDLAGEARLREIGRLHGQSSSTESNNYYSTFWGARKDHPDNRIDPEEAKQIAKSIIEAITDAGLQIVPVNQS